MTRLRQVQRTEGEPHDRLTELAGVAMEAIEQEGAEGIGALVMIQEGKEGGICIHGYDDDLDAAADLLMHTKAIFAANGQDLQFTLNRKAL